MIRAVTFSEANARQLSLMERDAFPDRLHPRTPADFAYMLEGGPDTVLADEDLALGYVILRLAADEGEIVDIGVMPDARRRGAGRRLLDAAGALAADRGAVRLFLEVAIGNMPARALYDAAGFGEIGRRVAYYKRPGGTREDALVMGLDLRKCPA